EKGRARGNFVYHGEQKGEINCPGERLEARRVLAAKARVNLLGDSRLLCPLFEPRKHLLLHVNADDLSRGPDHLCQWNAEEAHRAAEIQYGHSFLHVRSEDCARILPELSDRAGKKVAEPPRANPVSGFLCIIHRCCPPSLTTDSVRQSCKADSCCARRAILTSAAEREDWAENQRRRQGRGRLDRQRSCGRSWAE